MGWFVSTCWWYATTIYFHCTTKKKESQNPLAFIWAFNANVRSCKATAGSVGQQNCQRGAGRAGHRALHPTAGDVGKPFPKPQLTRRPARVFRSSVSQLLESSLAAQIPVSFKDQNGKLTTAQLARNYLRVWRVDNDHTLSAKFSNLSIRHQVACGKTPNLQLFSNLNWLFSQVLSTPGNQTLWLQIKYLLQLSLNVNRKLLNKITSAQI